MGFDGTGNASELGHAIDALNLADDIRIGLIAHSRGGLVARAFMNKYRNGFWGDRTFLLITLGTPHHGTPAATPDWGLNTVNQWDVPLKDCLINWFYNNNDSNDRTPLCKRSHVTLRRATPVFNINDVGSLDLGWDNFDSSHGVPFSAITINVGEDIAVGRNHTVSGLDANSRTEQLTHEQADMDLHPSARTHGSLKELNQSEKYASKIIAYAGYFLNPKQSVTFEQAVADVGHVKYQYQARILSDFAVSGGIEPFFLASDGIVPIQSALFLKDSAGAQPPYTMINEQWCAVDQECRPHIALANNLKDLSRARNIRSIGDIDHTQLRNGGDDFDVQLVFFSLLRQDLVDAAKEVPTTSSPPIARFSLHAGSSPPVESCSTVPISIVSAAAALVPCMFGVATNAATGQALVTFVDSSSDSDGATDIKSRRWETTSGVLLSENRTTFDWGFKPGTYDVVLTVRDFAGHSSQAHVTITVSATATIFYDEHRTDIALGEPVIDSTGALYLARSQFSVSCGFGFCASWLQKIVPGGDGWIGLQVGDALNPLGIALGPGGRVYFQGNRHALYAFESDGTPVPGSWPVEFAPFFNNMFLMNTLVDFPTGEVFGKAGNFGGCAPGCEEFLRRLRSDGSEMWSKRESEEISGGSRVWMGPLRDIYVARENAIIRLDRTTGREVCRGTITNVFFTSSWFGSLSGVFGGEGGTVRRFDENCTNAAIYTSPTATRYVFYGHDSTRIFGYEYSASLAQPYDAQADRLVAISMDGQLEWTQEQIAPLFKRDVRALQDGVLYVLALDKYDGLKQKLFLVNADNGIVVTQIDATGLCQNCGVAVSPVDGSIYINDLGSTRIHRYESVFLPPAKVPSVSHAVSALPNTGASLSEGDSSFDFELVSAPTCPDGTTCPTFAAVSNGFPFDHWMPNDSTSKWIEPTSGTADTHQVGQYIFRLSFVATAAEAASARIVGRWAADDNGIDILINGVSTGSHTTGSFALEPFTISQGLRPGTNTLDFVVQNVDCNGCDATNPVGLRVEFTTPGLGSSPYWTYAAQGSSPLPGIENVAFDGIGNLYVAEKFFKDGCAFNFCGSRLLSISPRGQARWEVPNAQASFPYVGNDSSALHRVFTSPRDGTVYFVAGAATISAFDTAGQALAGWPRSVLNPDGTAPVMPDGRLQYFPRQHPLAIDDQDGTVYGAVLSAINAFKPDGTSKWPALRPAAGSLNGIIQGPQGDLYSFVPTNPVTFFGVDRDTGLQFCSHSEAVTLALMFGDNSGVFSVSEGPSRSLGRMIVRFNQDCTSTLLYTTAKAVIFPQATVQETLIAADADDTNSGDPASTRLLGISADGTFLWRNMEIFPHFALGLNAVRAQFGQDAYVIGEDIADGKQKVFILDSQTGSIRDSADLAPLCGSTGVAAYNNCDVAVSPAGATYVIDKAFGKITRIR